MDDHDFLAGGGEMGALIRAYDWAKSPLGEPSTWPQGLKTSVRLLLSTGHPMFLWWGPELIQFYNDAYRRSIGPERHPSAIGQRGRECWAEIWDIIGPQIEQVMAGRGFTWHENQLVPITRYGKREDVYWTYSYGPIDDPSAPHGVGGVLVVCTETTEQVAAEQRLRDEDRRKNEFLAMLGHELRNPLSAIQNASELLVRNAASDASTRKVGELLARQVTQLGTLVDDLLDLSSITQGRIELKREPVELGSVIALALESVEPLVRAKRHKVVNTGSAAPLYVNGDLSRIVQALSNVLTNAAKYTEEGGRIEVTLIERGESAMIEVTDNGAGISPELLPKIFDLFVQGHRASDRSQGGLGIGLSVVRRLVEMHGGAVSAASEGTGRGSTFKIGLPLASAPTLQRAAASHGERRTNARRVLVVDDNTDAADSLAALLRLSGQEADAAYTGRDALERMRASHADVVLLDIGLPEMDGYEVARRIRAEHGAIVVVALTGYGQAADVQRAADAGFNAHITKPVAFEELQRVLAEL